MGIVVAVCHIENLLHDLGGRVDNDPSREDQVQEQMVEVGQIGTHTVVVEGSTYPADKVLVQMVEQFLWDLGNKHLPAVLDISENLVVPSEVVW